MATRSMYEVEDVVATIFHALQTRQHALVIQAARELRISQEEELLVNVVIMAWLLCDPYKCPMTRSPTNENIYESLCEILDHFPPELPTYKPQFPVPMPLSTNDGESQTILETTIQTCFSNGYAKQCIRIMTMLLHKQPATCIRIFEIHGVSKSLLQLFDRIVYTPLAERLVQHVVIQRMFPTVPTLSKNTQKYAALWNTDTVGLSARTFVIPFHALPHWNLKPKPVTRIQYSLIPPAIQGDASMYWQSAGLSTEETMETWYTTHFPDDIPDEWSREEVQKSHVYSEQLTLQPQLCATKNDWQPAFLLCWS